LDSPTLCSHPWENARSPEESTKYWESPTSPTVYSSPVEGSVMVSVAWSYCRTVEPTKAWFTPRGRTAEDSSTGSASSISPSLTAFTWPASSTVRPCTSVTRHSTTVTDPGSTSSSAYSASSRWPVPPSWFTRHSSNGPSLGEPEVATVIAYRGESGACCTELATIEPIACSFVPRVPSP